MECAHGDNASGVSALPGRGVYMYMVLLSGLLSAPGSA